MHRRAHRLARVFVAATMLVAAFAATAHSSSDAYLTLESAPRALDGETVVHAQWDIALRDLDFVMGLDENGDGRITWAELRKRQAAIAAYAYEHLRASGDGKSCAIRPVGQMVDGHADGAYAVLYFDLACHGAPARLVLDYRLFFAIDPSHRGILVLRSGSGTATALLSPGNARIGLLL